MTGGTAKTRNLLVTGNGTSQGGEFRKVRITGESVVNGSLTCERLKVMGQMEVNGDLISQAVNVLGLLSVNGACNSELFQVRGVFDIAGLLNSGNIDVRLFGPCHAAEIGGGRIRIRRKRLHAPNAHHLTLTVDTVEGDDIQLEYTRAKVVRGDVVKVGAGCEIDLVEYRSDFWQSPEARVGAARRV